MRRSIERRDFLKFSALAAAGAGLDPRLSTALERSKRKEMGPLAPGADLDLTQFWDDGVYILTPDRGRIRIRAGLFIEKWTTFNYDYETKEIIVLPEEETLMQWNSHEAIENWGIRILRPGDEIAFTENIDVFDKLTRDEYGKNGKHGNGYVINVNGICNAATTLGEALGIEVEVDGIFIPLFIARPGSIQPHNYAHNPKYYDYAYNGLGIGVSPTVDRGHMPFMVNPNLPATVVVALGMEARDTHPGKKRMGIYKPTVIVEVEGLPTGTGVRYQRTTANRETIIRRVIGARDYIMSDSPSVYFDENGIPLLGGPIPPIDTFDPQVVIETTTMMETIMQSYLRSSRVPDSLFPEGMFPGMVSRPATHIGVDSVYWERPDTLLAIAVGDLPAPMSRMSAVELLRILSWNNVDRKENRRYEKGNGMLAVADWAEAYRFQDYPISAPIPRWMTIRKKLITASIFYDWLAVDPASALLGWRVVTGGAKEAQDLVNKWGYFVPIITRSKRSVGNSPIAIVAPGEGKVDKSGNFWPNVVDGTWRLGPKNGKTVRDCMGYALNNSDYFPPAYFVWVPPDLE